MNLPTLLWKARHFRHHLRMGWKRARLEANPIASGLGDGIGVLTGLVRTLKPDVCVEIGSAAGWSTCQIGLALRTNLHGRLYAIDPHMSTSWNDQGSTDTHGILKSNLSALRLNPWVEVIRATSEAAVRDWRTPIDLLFIDGDHSYEGVKRDWELFSPHVRRFGLVVFHDTIWDLEKNPQWSRSDMGVPRFVEELRIAGYPVITLDRCCGISLVQAMPGGFPLALDAARSGAKGSQ